MQERLKIGTILKPQGIMGEVKIKPITDDVRRFKSLKKVFVNDKEYKVLNARISPEAVFLSLSGVADRNTAELLRNLSVEVLREDSVKLPDGNYFIVDVLGATLYLDDGEEVGKITYIEKFNVDVYTVETSKGKILRFPFLKDLNPLVDIENKKVVVGAKRFSEVAVYED